MILVGHFQLGIFWFHLYLFHIFRFTVHFCPWLICKSRLFFFFSWEPQKKKTRKDQEKLFLEQLLLLFLEQFQKVQMGNCKSQQEGKSLISSTHPTIFIHTYTKAHCIQINKSWWKYKKQMTTVVKFNLPYGKRRECLAGWFLISLWSLSLSFKLPQPWGIISFHSSLAASSPRFFLKFSIMNVHLTCAVTGWLWSVPLLFLCWSCNSWLLVLFQEDLHNAWILSSIQITRR